ncbi:DUF523 domain-containing protein [Fusobacterium sp.]|uniref:DUF523 domain-containing protein n=1 Tax=Fusobacterium sp. TaxID=68766 RepID=UPI002615DBCC|nr:DUF523 domain-containing protein [Fusobacterium sp.]
MILISACLAGINCKYSGKNNLHSFFKDLVNSGKAVPICPEQLGGLVTPRDPAEIIKDNSGNIKVITKNGVDVTEEYVLGAKRALAIAKALDIKTAILQSRSPSCGCGTIYDGTFSKHLIDGNGITAELFIKNGIKVFSDEDYLKQSFNNQV